MNDEKMSKYWVQYVCEISDTFSVGRCGTVEIPGLIINEEDVEKLECAIKEQLPYKDTYVQMAQEIWISAFSRFDMA